MTLYIYDRIEAETLEEAYKKAQGKSLQELFALCNDENTRNWWYGEPALQGIETIEEPKTED